MIPWIVDAICILLHKKVLMPNDTKWKPTLQVGKSGTFWHLPFDWNYTKSICNDAISKIAALSSRSSDPDDRPLTDEQAELLEPYVRHLEFTEANARNSAGDTGALLFQFANSMREYQIQSKALAPLQLEKSRAEEKERQERAKLEAAAAQTRMAEEEVAKLNAQREALLERLRKLQDDMKANQSKMQRANDLLSKLKDNRDRWESDAKRFAQQKRRLIGDCAVASAFVSYLGPFNFEFRKYLMLDSFLRDARENCEPALPISEDISIQAVNTMFVNESMIAVWNNQGLPRDDLSIQNGILVTYASRWPLLIDPQNQGFRWIMESYDNLPKWDAFGSSGRTMMLRLGFQLRPHVACQKLPA